MVSWVLKPAQVFGPIRKWHGFSAECRSFCGRQLGLLLRRARSSRVSRREGRRWTERSSWSRIIIDDWLVAPRYSVVNARLHVLEGTEDSQSIFGGSASAVPSVGTLWTTVATSANYLWNGSSISGTVTMMPNQKV